MPWALFNRPSIQLGTLKAYLKKNCEDIQVDTEHVYLETASILGPALYHWISRNPWVSEALYAPLLFPEQFASAQSLARKHVRKAALEIKSRFHFKTLVERLEHQLAEWVADRDWDRYDVIGFSVCFHQLCASLAAARAIKKKSHGPRIVFGGSSCGADTGKSLLKAFPFIDHVVEGEGEKTLLHLCAFLTGTGSDHPPGNTVAGLPSGQSDIRRKSVIAAEQFSSLDELPIPDYRPYFAALQKWFAAAPFIPVIPLEFSRGCWWNRCAFCNLNLQWCGYRFKKPARVLQEVTTLARRHSCLDFTFVDNMLPPRESLELFQMTAAAKPDYSFFAEIRSAGGDKKLADTFAVYRKGGLSSIQVGIEALSSSLLKKMTKGITAIENIAAMRHAMENGIRLEGNLILQFPGSSEAEVTETLAALDYVFPYPPLTGAAFFLGHDSPVYNNPHKYGIRAIVNHVDNARLFPQTVLPKLQLLVKAYRGDRALQKKIWVPVQKKIKIWQECHAAKERDVMNKPLLSYRDGGDFLLIRQELPDSTILHHRLRNTSRLLYLFCTRIRTLKEVEKKFPGLPSSNILSFLAELQRKRILFCEKNRYLSLAVRDRK
jgi:ribosomal peptide maturation radical SAM protein 1